MASLLDVPHVYHWFSSVGVQLQDVQMTTVSVIGRCANAIATLHSRAQYYQVPRRGVEVQMLIDIQGGIWLWLPGFDFASGNAGEVCWVVQDELGIPSAAPPAPVSNTSSLLLVTATCKVFRWTG
jgi:hypothetical protein